MQASATVLALFENEEAFRAAFEGAVLAALPASFQAVYVSGVNAGIKSARQKGALLAMRSHQEQSRKALASAQLYRERILALAIKYAAAELRDILKSPEGTVVKFESSEDRGVS